MWCVCVLIQGAGHSKPTCVAKVTSLKRVDFVALHRKQGAQEEGHHLRVGFAVQLFIVYKVLTRFRS